MKKLVFVLTLLLIYNSSKAQTVDVDALNLRILELENRNSLRTLVDTFSILADVKDAQAQTLLFTENAIVETYSNGRLSTKLEGRKQIGEVFGNFLSNFKTVYHFNGQHQVTIKDDKATGILYCLTILINDENVKTTFGIHYNDEYVYVNGHWLISKRTSSFDWQEVQQPGQ